MKNVKQKKKKEKKKKGITKHKINELDPQMIYKISGIMQKFSANSTKTWKVDLTIKGESLVEIILKE